jgi:DNA-binding response OmpR family regulator
MRRRILIIDDDVALARVLLDNFAREGYDAQHARSGAGGLNYALGWRPDLVILELILPDLDGFDVCRDLTGSALGAMIVLSVRSSDRDKIRALDLGADDYVTKPFSVGELLARVRAVLRRVNGHRAGTLPVRFADVVVDFQQATITRAGIRVPFTQKELELLRFLLNHPGRVFTRDELLLMVWGYHEAPLTRTVDTHMARLRQKLEADPHNPRHLQTVYGTGYVFTPPL